MGFNAADPGPTPETSRTFVRFQPQDYGRADASALTPPEAGKIEFLRTSRDAAADSAAGEASSGPSASPLALHSLVRQIEEVARTWNLTSAAASAVAIEPGLPTPEALAMIGAQHGLDVSVRHAGVGSLDDRDFPCIVLLRDGTTVLLSGRRGADFLAREDGAERLLRRAELAGQEAGILFGISPAVSRLTPTDARKGLEAETLTLPGVLRIVTHEVWRHHRGRLVQLVVANLIGNILLLALPLYSMAVYDRVIPHMAMETLWALSIGAAIALGSDLMVRIVKARVTDAVAFSVSTRVQARFFNRLLHIELAGAPRNAAAAAAGLRDIEGLCLAIPGLVGTVLVDLPFLLVIGALLVSFGGWVAVVPVLGILVLVAMHAVSHLASEKETLQKAVLSRAQANLLQEAIDGLEGVKIAHAERQLLRRWERLADAAAYAGHRSRLWGGVANHVSISLGQFVVVFAMFAAVLEISNGLLTIGALSATSMLVGRMLAPVTQVVSALHHMSMLLKTLDGIDGVLKAPIEEAGDPTRPHRVAGPIRFNAVSFTYSGEGDTGLKDVTFSIAPGEKVALIGRIGCGKSTLLKLTTRLLVPQAGSVTIDGTDIRQYHPGAVRRSVGFMSQNPALFDDTLHANLVFGLGAVAEADFERAVILSGVKDLAARHPQGYSMRVGPRGERLSGGERQLVGLARCLMGNPPVLILDEPTASMDNALEARIIRDLKAATADRTLVVATHRATMLELVDRIIWLEDGRIVMDGARDQVLSRLKRSAA